MRTYDPAESILYVHLTQNPATPPAPRPPARNECHRLSRGYANASLRVRLEERRPGTGPALHMAN
jgi:hypothetical protein